ncbi:MAG: MgtC/SapB family protein [Clostridia bacterium]|nr:MgtC/SapB family protein [Clostridia bacterium]
MSITEIFIRIFLAILIGGFIGFEREMNNRPAGFVTHTLVCVGACVVSLIQIHMVQDTVKMIAENPVMANALKADIGRVVAQVVTGVGFLGAGTIFMDKGSVKGLTTATTIWVVACIGLAIGLGYYATSVIATVGVAFVILVLRKFEHRALNRKYKMKLTVTCDRCKDDLISELTAQMNSRRVQVRDIEIKSVKEDEMVYVFKLYTGFTKNKHTIVENIANNEHVINIKVD